MNHAIHNAGYFVRYYYRQIILLLLIITGLCLCRGYALTQEQYDEAGFDKVVYDWIDEMAGTQTAKDVAKAVEVTYNGSSVSISGVEVSGVAPVLTKLNDVVKMLAMTFLIVSFGISLLNMRPNDTTEEEIFRRLVMLVLGIILCSYALDICMTLANIGSQVAAKISNIIPDAGGGANSMVNDFKDYVYSQCHPDSSIIWWKNPMEFVVNHIACTGKAIYFILQLLFPWLILKGTGIFVNVICWSRAIEILLLSAFSPLAFADIIEPNNLGSSPGMRFIKNFIALTLSGALIITAIIICQSINAAMLGNTVTGDQKVIDAVWKMVVVGLAQVSMVMKANQIAKSALGMG